MTSEENRGGRIRTPSWPSTGGGVRLPCSTSIRMSNGSDLPSGLRNASIRATTASGRSRPCRPRVDEYRLDLERAVDAGDHVVALRLPARPHQGERRPDRARITATTGRSATVKAHAYMSTSPGSRPSKPVGLPGVSGVAGERRGPAHGLCTGDCPGGRGDLGAHDRGPGLDQRPAISRAGRTGNDNARRWLNTIWIYDEVSIDVEEIIDLDDRALGITRCHAATPDAPKVDWMRCHLVSFRDGLISQAKASSIATKRSKPRGCGSSPVTGDRRSRRGEPDQREVRAAKR